MKAITFLIGGGVLLAGLWLHSLVAGCIGTGLALMVVGSLPSKPSRTPSLGEPWGRETGGPRIPKPDVQPGGQGGP